MAVLDYYKYVNNYYVDINVPKPEVEEKESIPLMLQEPKTITLAQYNPVTSDLITAHNLKDYRRKVFTLLLLPKADILFNKVLERSYYSEFL